MFCLIACKNSELWVIEIPPCGGICFFFFYPSLAGKKARPSIRSVLCLKAEEKSRKISSCLWICRSRTVCLPNRVSDPCFAVQKGWPRSPLELFQVLHIKANTPGALTERKRSEQILIALFPIFRAF